MNKKNTNFYKDVNLDDLNDLDDLDDLDDEFTEDILKNNNKTNKEKTKTYDNLKYNNSELTSTNKKYNNKEKTSATTKEQSLTKEIDNFTQEKSSEYSVESDLKSAEINTTKITTSETLSQRLRRSFTDTNSTAKKYTHNESIFLLIWWVLVLILSMTFLIVFITSIVDQVKANSSAGTTEDSIMIILKSFGVVFAILLFTFYMFFSLYKSYIYLRIYIAKSWEEKIMKYVYEHKLNFDNYTEDEIKAMIKQDKEDIKNFKKMDKKQKKEAKKEAKKAEKEAKKAEENDKELKDLDEQTNNF